MALNDHDNTCVVMHATLCVGATNVDKAKKTNAHKEIPSRLTKQTRKHDIAINMPKTIVGQTSKKEVRQRGNT